MDTTIQITVTRLRAGSSPEVVTTTIDPQEFRALPAVAEHAIRRLLDVVSSTPQIGDLPPPAISG